MKTATATATVIDQSWGWAVCCGDYRTPKISSAVAAEEFAGAINAGEDRTAAWERLEMRQYVRRQDGGTYNA